MHMRETQARGDQEIKPRLSLLGRHARMTSLMSSASTPSSDPHRVDAILERMRDFVVESDAPITRDDLDVILGALSRASSPRGLLACLPFRASDGGNALAFLAILVPGFRNDGRGGPRRVRTLVDDAQAAAAAVSLRLAETAVTLAASDATVSPSPVAAWLWQAAGTLSGLTAATTSDMATPTPTDHPDSWSLAIVDLFASCGIACEVRLSSDRRELHPVCAKPSREQERMLESHLEQAMTDERGWPEILDVTRGARCINVYNNERSVSLHYSPLGEENVP